jgi:hypothetical protein
MTVQGLSDNANAVLAALLAGSETPEDAACQLWTIADNDRDGSLPLLADFRNLAITLDVMEEFEAQGDFDRAAWREELRDLARRVLAHGGVSRELILDGDRLCTFETLSDGEEASDGA